MPYIDIEKRTQYQHDWWQLNKHKHTDRNRKRNAEYRSWFIEVTPDAHCIYCGDRDRTVLDWHHVNPATKSFGIARSLRDRVPKIKILEELDKCVTLCSNCHRKFHSGSIKLELADVTGNRAVVAR